VQPTLRLHGKRILVADAEPDTLAELEDALSAHGADVVIAPDIRASLAALASDRFDAAVVGFLLPDGPGAHVVEQLVATGVGAVMIATIHAAHVLASARACGAVDLAWWPTDHRTLVGATARACDASAVWSRRAESLRALDSIDRRPPAGAQPRDGALLDRCAPLEQRVCALVAHGLQDQEIADELRVECHQVKYRVRKLVRMFAVRNRAGLAALLVHRTRAFDQLRPASQSK
jgi:DNA-binding NarL/FixJ family response regulator